MSTYMHPLFCYTIQNTPTRHTVGVRKRAGVLRLFGQFPLLLPLYGSLSARKAIAREGISTPGKGFCFLSGEKLRHAIRFGSATREDVSATTLDVSVTTDDVAATTADLSATADDFSATADDVSATADDVSVTTDVSLSKCNTCTLHWPPRQGYTTAA